MSATPSNTPQDLAELQNAVGEGNGNAIAKFVDGRITKAFADNRSELTELIERVKAMAATNPGDPVVKDAAKVVSSAAKEHNALGDVTEYPSDEQAAKVARDADRVQKAAKVVDKAETDLAARVSAVEERQGNHEERICGLEDRQAGIVSNLDQVWSEVRANANAIAMGGNGSALTRAVRVALTVFGVVGIGYWLIWWLTPLDYEFLTNLGLAAALGGVAGWIALLWSSEDGNQSSAAASAEATNGGQHQPVHDPGLDIVRPLHSGAAASAAAHQGGGQSTGGASASSAH